MIKEIFELMEKDYMAEDFSRSERILYGIVVPVLLAALIWGGAKLAETLSNL